MRSSSPKTQTPALLIGIVDDRNLIVQRPEIIDVTDTKDTKRAQINNTADPFPNVKSVNPKETEESYRAVFSLSFKRRRRCNKDSFSFSENVLPWFRAF